MSFPNFFSYKNYLSGDKHSAQKANGKLWNEPKNFLKFWKWEDGKTNEQDKRRMETQVTRWVANKQTLERTAFWPN